MAAHSATGMIMAVASGRKLKPIAHSDTPAATNSVARKPGLRQFSANSNEDTCSTKNRCEYVMYDRLELAPVTSSPVNANTESVKSASHSLRVHP